MDKEYLEDYNERERAEYERFFKSVQQDRFSFETDRYPPDERFVKIQRPVASTTLKLGHARNVWAQVPFCGSLILPLMPIPPDEYEKHFFKISEIPKIIDFIKNTGKIQIVLNGDTHFYEGLDYLKPFFEELRPPRWWGASLPMFWDKSEVKKATDIFYELGKVRYLDFLHIYARQRKAPFLFPHLLKDSIQVYGFLRLQNYSIVEDIENLMVDDPQIAKSMIYTCKLLIFDPFMELRSDTTNFALSNIEEAKGFPLIYRPKEIRFPCEIGKFLLSKLTYAPQGLDASKELMYHYNAYDLQKVQKSLNKAILANRPDLLDARIEELSEILDNVWDDKSIPRRIENINIGVPIIIAAIGSIAGALLGSTPGAVTGGLLAELGFKIGEKAAPKFFSEKAEGLSERIAKLRTKSYQANIYDFKKKYKI